VFDHIKGGKDAFQPQINSKDAAGAAAARDASGYGNTASQFADSYYNQHVAPATAGAQDQSDTSRSALNTAANADTDTQQTQADLANNQGAAAQRNYYNMAANYNAPEEFERQAQLAKGDVGQAEANQELATQQRRAALGVDPTSGQAQAMSQQNQVSNTATEAQAMTNARNAARSLGMQLSQSAAQQGNQNVSNAVQAGQGATAASTGAFGVASGNVSAQNAGAAVPLQGKQLGIQGAQAAGNIYNSQLGSFASLGNNSLNESQANKTNTVNNIGKAAGIAGKAAKVPGF
jgi:hypothetical protein